VQNILFYTISGLFCTDYQGSNFITLAMLLLSYIRDNRDEVIQGLTKRHFTDAEKTISKVLLLDDERRGTQSENDGLLFELNTLSKEIGVLMKEGKKEEADKVKSKTAEIKTRSKDLGDSLSRIELELQGLLLSIPNVPSREVPEGVGENDNQVIYEHGKEPELHPDASPHWDLIKKYDIIDFDLGIKITGAGFPVYKGAGARLQRSMINFFLDEAVRAGYTEVQPPIVINEASGIGTGQLPDKDGQMYQIPEENFYLIPTAEVPITNLYRDMILTDEQLPVKNVGFTPCFRREAGSWGAHVRGLNRLHQFDKVELVRVEKPENSEQVLQEMCAYVQGLLEKLELPYRVLSLCAGDLGFTSAQTFDMEVYSGAQKKWLEVSSVSNFKTYQTNRLKLRYRSEKDQKPVLLHTLNGSALALPRIIAAILENNQTPEGIRIPSVLVPYTGFDMIY
jgi:seryl-tRNA synthetase